MRLTYAVLGSFSKYPFSSKQSTITKKKFGFMIDDERAADLIFTAIGMKKNNNTCRHPLAFVVEAADDISYLTTDIDDAHRLRQLPCEDCEKLLYEIVGSGQYDREYKKFRTENNQDKVSFLRSLASATLIDGVVQTFLDRQRDIMNGEFQGTFVDMSHYATAAKTIIDTCKEKVYIERNKIQLEAAGFNVILGLMNLFGEMIEEYIGKSGIVKDMDQKDQNLYHLLPEESRTRMNHCSCYSCMIVLVDYIAGMTDRFALDLYQRLCGHSPVIGRMG